MTSANDTIVQNLYDTIVTMTPTPIQTNPNVVYAGGPPISPVTPVDPVWVLVAILIGIILLFAWCLYSTWKKTTVKS